VSGRVGDDRIPDHHYPVDYHHDLFMLIDPETADMTRWSLTIDTGYSSRTYPFERMTAFRSRRALVTLHALR
jgi:hypothetical protein